MCGICGILNTEPARPVDRGTLAAMTGALRHRGPDDEGTFAEGRVGLGVRRLAVIDLEGGAQPQHDETRTRHVVHNGEIYNFRELRRVCEARGHRFSTRSDTEVLVHLHEDHGERAPENLNGMFAFAVWDSGADELLLVRDRLGIKPLYYAETPRAFLFASEIKALLRHPELDRTIDPVALDQYLAYKYVPAPRTIFRSVRKLPPGHLLVYRGGRTEVRPYWRLRFAAKADLTDDEAARGLLERLERAVERQRIADVPLGAFLSGGIDSGLLVALLSRITGQPVRTFSVGFPEKSFNELDDARLVAERFGTEHHEIVVTPQARELFETIVPHFDEPFGDSSAVPTYLLCRLAREHVTVALSGTGADELFAGYDRYRAIPLARGFDRFPEAVRALAREALERLPAGRGKKDAVVRARRFVESSGRTPLDRHRSLVGVFGEPERAALYRRGAGPPREETDDPLAALYESSDGPDELDRLLDLDTRSLLADDYLVKDDRMSMAVSLEVRVPYLDHELVEFAASLPARLKLRGLTSKWILRRSAEGILPAPTVQRAKQGFEVPVGRWIAGDLRETAEELLLSPRTRDRGLFEAGVVRNLLENHLTGRENLAGKLWSLMSLEMWFRAILDEEGSRPSGNREGWSC
jgi:asparagine synthase (glutamine-hydrolysing)